MAISSINDYELNSKSPRNWLECNFRYSGSDYRTKQVANRIFFVPFFVRKETPFDAIGGSDGFVNDNRNIMGLYSSTKNCVPNKLIVESKRLEGGRDGFIEFDSPITLKPGIYWGAEGIDDYRTRFVAGGFGMFDTIFTTSLENATSVSIGYYITYNTTSEDKMPKEINADDIKESVYGSPYLALRVAE